MTDYIVSVTTYNKNGSKRGTVYYGVKSNSANSIKAKLTAENTDEGVRVTVYTKDKTIKILNDLVRDNPKETAKYTEMIKRFESYGR